MHSNLTPVAWTRFWREINASGDNRDAGDGFLADWAEIFGHPLDDGLLKLGDMLNKKCIVLCGEPGMGKTTELEKARPLIQQLAAQRLLWHNFRRSFGPEWVISELQQAHQWMAWEKGEADLVVVIDGVDEGLVYTPKFLAAFVQLLEAKPVERLKLIVSCRDAEWPEPEGTELLKLWKTNEASKFKLQRLRNSDASLAARHWGLSESQAERFMSQIYEKKVETFAARPITLQMLVEQFRLNSTIPRTRIDIFKHACLRLCADDHKRHSRRSSSLSPKHLLEAAQYIAAAMLLGRHSGVSRLPSEARPEGHLSFDSLFPDTADHHVQVQIATVLETALFSDAGAQGRSFTHLSYAEFCAAQFLKHFPLAQILQLLCIHEGGRHFLIPQLAEISGWVSLEHTDFRAWVVQSEPEVLLRNDAAMLPDRQKAEIVESLLKRMAKEEVFEYSNLSRFGTGLLHPTIYSQIQPFLQSKAANEVVKGAVIYISFLGRLSEAFDDLLNIARDIDESPDLRSEAFGSAVGILLHAESKAALNPSLTKHRNHPSRSFSTRIVQFVPFARQEMGPDPGDQLRGYAIRALVPHFWTVSQALPAVKLPRNGDTHGEFAWCCGSHLPKELQTDDLVAVFAELRDVPSLLHGINNRYSSLTRKAMVLAVENASNNSIRSALISFIRDRVFKSDLDYSLLGEEWHDATAAPSFRRDLFEIFATSESITASEFINLINSCLTTCTEDVTWILSKIEVTTGIHQECYIQLLARMSNAIVDSPAREDFLQACGKIKELDQVMTPLLRTDLASPVATWQKRRWQDMRGLEQRPPRIPTPSLAERFEIYVQMATSDPNKWVELAWHLQSESAEQNPVFPIPDPMKAPQWKLLSEGQQSSVLNCARQFLLHSTNTAWQGSNLDSHLHVFWALWLTHDSILRDVALQASIHATWFAYLCARPFHGVLEEQLLTSLAVKLDSARAAKILLHRLNLAINVGNSPVPILSSFELSWTSMLTEVVLEFVRDRKVTGVAFRQTLEFLARNDKTSLHTWLINELLRPDAPEPAMRFAVMLAYFPENLGNPAVSGAKRRRVLLRETLQSIADLHAIASESPLERFSPYNFGRLFDLVALAFPAKRQRLLPSEVEARQRIEQLRHFIPKQLTLIASAASCAELLRLADKFKDSRIWLKKHWRDAQIAHLKNEWKPTPADVISRMKEHADRRWIRNEADLVNLVVESLGRFGAALNGGDRFIGHRLWNENPAKPKPERRLTQEIANWLNDDLSRNSINVACEVQPTTIHQLDIEVICNVTGAGDRDTQLSVVIEVKRHFNQEAESGFETQLVHEYLKRRRKRSGIYVVGWYSCLGWKSRRGFLGAKTFLEARSGLGKLLEEMRAKYPDLRLEALCLECELVKAFRKRGLKK